MYRVLIADDEPSVTESLEKYIEWKELGLEVAGIVENGREVLDFLEQNRIDIVILDIRMPGLTGLEVCEHIHNIYEKLQIIIISGYAEFSYAERAISYGVLGYCLKPQEYDKVTRLLIKAVKKCEKRGRKNSEVDLLEAIESNNISDIKRKLVSVGVENDKIWVMVSTGKNRISLKSPHLVVEIGREQFGYLSEKKYTNDVLQEFMKDGNILGIGYMEELVSVEKIPEALDVCLTGAFQYFVNTNQRICSNLNMPKAMVYLSEIRELLERNKWDIIKKKLKEMQIKEYQDFTIRSALKLCNMIHNGNLFSEIENDYYVYSLRQLVSDYTNIRQMLKCLYQDIEAAGEQRKNTAEYTNVAFMELMEFIEDNYKEDISLSKVAEHCHMNSNYVSQLFKKETGTTFVHYVTQLRMKEAIRLLQTTNKSTAEISALVGFNDYFYFLKTFKKYTGKTLGQYRAEG